MLPVHLASRSGHVIGARRGSRVLVMAHDVLVLGATVAGLTVARRLARIGYDVVVLDPNAEGRSAAIGHGVAAVGHASTMATMDHAYGPGRVQEHTSAQPRRHGRDRAEPPGGDRGAAARQLAAWRQTRGDPRGRAPVPGGGRRGRRSSLAPGRGARHQGARPRPDGVRAALRAAAVAAGAQVVDVVTVTHLTRREGSTRICFRNNLAWVREAEGMITGVAGRRHAGRQPLGKGRADRPGAVGAGRRCRVPPTPSPR